MARRRHSVIRPDRVTLKRYDSDQRDAATGAAGGAVVTLNTNVPATLQAALRADVVVTVIGSEQYMQTDLLIIDGLGRAEYAGVAPGGTVVVNGFTYTVASNGRGAFVDLRANDKVIDAGGVEYLVLAVRTGEFTRTLQARLSKGRVWPG
jgi:hypothetical protein